MLVGTEDIFFVGVFFGNVTTLYSRWQYILIEQSVFLFETKYQKFYGSLRDKKQMHYGILLVILTITRKFCFSCVKNRKFFNLL